MMIKSEKNQPVLLPSLNSWGNDEWRAKAQCKGIDPSTFFTVDVIKVKSVKKICENCSVKEDCLQFALTNEISWGIYGGMTPKERNRAFKHVVSK